MTAPRARPALRAQLLTAGAGAITAVGIGLAVLEPPWLTGPLHTAVVGAGPWAPALLVALCVVAAPLHLTGLLTALSLVAFPLPVAVGLSYVGGVLGCVLTAVLLARMGTRRASRRDGWPAWAERLSDRVARRPLLVGIVVRLVLQSGLAVEAFFLLAGYTRRRYAIVTLVGFGLYLAQGVLGILAVAALVQVSPWLGLLAVAAPLAGAAAVVLVRRRRLRLAAVTASAWTGR